MLTHTGRTYDPGSVHPRRCEFCAAVATWLIQPSPEWQLPRPLPERACHHHAWIESRQTVTAVLGPKRRPA